ncbi:N-acetylmuramoyl-L-alanine amidase [Clostridium sp. DJ247]|uniref:N-acetylmuramoyl-L-alanine amidase n=1 Tax=Clostridium sp. DJ247 TaxID=2726188 RepID=UPI00162A86E8|nr:N-acetylmuramoyl-L-alanine amidase [Clostridium sp. DJ247]MBC2581284.1 N-acetylmuramoyl-L-alanine amidase [Clostridium sp. DJ247]
MNNKRNYLLFWISFLTTIVLFSSTTFVKAADAYSNIEPKSNIDTSKSWTIRFNRKIDKNTINSSNILVQDENGQSVPISIKSGDDGRSIIVSPKNQYDYGKTYNLVIKDGIKASDKNISATPSKLQFITKANPANSANKNYTICIDAAHGGSDDGNVSTLGVKEKDINLAVALKVGKILQDNGVNVVYTRQSDNVAWNKDNDLQPRFDVSNNSKADFFVSIRCNAYPDNPSASGIETYYSDRDNTGKKLAQSIQGKLVKNTQFIDRGTKVGLAQHEILRGTTANAVMVELGFLTNVKESTTMATDDFQSKSASAIASGILESLSLVDKSSSSISSVSDISDKIVVGNDYKLPLSVKASMSDGTSKTVNVIWDSNTIDTSKEGSYTYKGAIPGYGKTILLTLNVITKPDVTTSQAICIDPGHGLGRDTGATGIDGLQEDDITLAVGLKVGKILEDHGVSVVYTRTTDMRSTPMSVVDSLQKRCDISNNANARYFVSIHNNSADDPAALGTETWDNPGDEDSAKLAEAVQNNIVQQLGTYDRGLKDGYGRGLYVIKNTNAPSILIELGFLSNPEDVEKLKSDDYQQKFAQAIADGILQRLGK